ncbi:MAG: hypothetical protein LBD59_09715 [Prevotellaceae bacterium]|jgi:hypothetical protein|nr:hypothetical protein [Prevotellaceae bacterium]
MDRVDKVEPCPNSRQAAPANKGANAGTACKDRVDKVEPCPNSRGGALSVRRLKPPVNKVLSLRDFGLL